MLEIESALQKKYLISHPRESARILEKMKPVDAAKTILHCEALMAGTFFEKVTPDAGALIANELPEDYVVLMIPKLSNYYTVSMLSRLTKEKRESLLKQLPKNTQDYLKKSLQYPSDCAGALMEPDFIALHPDLNVEQAIERLRQIPGHHIRRIIFIVDEDFHLEKKIDLQTLALAEKNTPLRELASDVQAYVNVTDDTEKVIAILEKYRITDLPVIDYDNRLLGIIPYDTLMETSKDEAISDLLTMVGASKDERALSSATFSIKKRLPWLQINLLTAFLAASVVGLFENTIATFTVLAVLMPIVAGQSGNTGSQALAVTIRGLALREIQPQQWLGIIFKEGRIGLFNGLVVALTTSAGVFFWSHSGGLALIIGLSMIVSMFIASMAGAAVPLILSGLKQDPAQSSSVILTTITDVCGFASFLGTATLLSFLLT
jgi:magnesium transporter